MDYANLANWYSSLDTLVSLKNVCSEYGYITGRPSSRLEKKPTINLWKRHALCGSVLSHERNRREFEHVARNSMGNEIWSIYNDKYINYEYLSGKSIRITHILCVRRSFWRFLLF